MCDYIKAVMFRAASHRANPISKNGCCDNAKPFAIALAIHTLCSCAGISSFVAWKIFQVDPTKPTVHFPARNADRRWLNDSLGSFRRSPRPDEARCNDQYTRRFETFLAATQEMDFDESEGQDGRRSNKPGQMSIELSRV
jgi:hypothetical protein